jgi:hypothetical protein
VHKTRHLSGKPASVKKAWASVTVMRGEGHRDRGDDRLERAGSHPAQCLFGFGKGWLNRIPIRRVGGQKDELAPGRLDERSGVGALMDAEVVEHDDLARAQAGDQDPVPEGLEDESINGPPHQETLAQARHRQSRQPRDSLPPSARDSAVRPLPACRPRPQGRQGRGGTGLIEKDQLRRIDLGHRRPPGDTGDLVPFGGDQALFLSRSPSLARSRLRCEGLSETPVAAASRAACSGKVASGWAKTSARNCS